MSITFNDLKARQNCPNIFLDSSYLFLLIKAEEPSYTFLVGLEFTSSLSMFSNRLTGERQTLGWLRLLMLSFLALACEMYLLVRFVVVFNCYLDFLLL